MGWGWKLGEREEAHAGCSGGSNDCGRATCWCWGAGLNAGEEVPGEGGADGRGAWAAGWLWAGGRILIFRGTEGQGQGWQRMLTAGEGESWGGVLCFGATADCEAGSGVTS